MDNSFWDAFWPGFLATIVSGLIFTFIITYLIRTFKRPKLEIGLDIGTGLNGFYSLNMYCINRGRVGLLPNEIQWHFYYDLPLRPKEAIEGCEQGSTIYNEKALNFVTGFNKLPCLPGSSVKLVSVPVKVNITLVDDLGLSHWIDEGNFYFSLTTSYGEYSEVSFNNNYHKAPCIEDDLLSKMNVYKLTRIRV